MIDISIIVPIGPKEEAWRDLLNDVNNLPNNVEIIFVICKETQMEQVNKVRWILSKKTGRAEQLNVGALSAKNNFLWFIHADSRLTKNTLSVLLKNIKKKPNALHYFNLKFYGGSKLMKINEIGVWIRSHLFFLPFGDQSFCIAKKIFEKIGGYPEHVNYGEDHLLIWHARQNGIKLNCVGKTILTSARKYKIQGWFYTTFMHQLLWIKQGFIEWLKLLKKIAKKEL